MPDAVFTYRMPAGVPGEVTRLQTLGTTVEADVVNSTAALAGAALSPPSWSYGNLVVVDANGARPIVAGDAAWVPTTMALLARPFPTGDVGLAFPSGVIPFGSGSPPTSGIVNVLRRGYMSVKLGGAAVASRVSGVYYQGLASTGTHIQGALEASAATGCVLIPNAYFMGPADSNGNVEVAFAL